jgi:ethanolaminephosphotransferase
MTFTSRILATVVSTTILPLALVLFASGFFPYKPFLPGLATFGADENGSRPPPVFDRVILLVIDALRRYWPILSKQFRSRS